MATSAFKSTTRRTAVGASSSTDDSGSSNPTERAHRRSRSLSRISRRLSAPNSSNVAPAPRGRFANTVRGSPFPEVSLDDLAIELLSDETGCERGRSPRRISDVSPFSPAGASLSRGRSVSRQNESIGDATFCASRNPIRGRSVGNRSSGDQHPRRRRSISVVRHQVTESEGDVDHSYKLHSNGIRNSFISRNTQLPSLEKQKASNHHQGLGNSWSQKDLSKLQDGYSSQSSVLTDDESRDMRSSKNGIQRATPAVYSQKPKHPNGEGTYTGLYEAMRVELKHALDEIKKELGRTKARSKSSALENDNSDTPQTDSTIRSNYASKSKLGKDRNRVSERLTEEAEKYFEDFISNVEDTDISSFDGERSDGSSTLGGVTKPKGSLYGDLESRSPTISKPVSIEMDGVILPWLRWEVSDDDSPISFENRKQPLTPTSYQPVTSQMEGPWTIHDVCTYYASSSGNWSPGASSSVDGPSQFRTSRSGHDMDDYARLQNSQDLLFETVKQQHNIKSGRLLLCCNLSI